MSASEAARDVVGARSLRHHAGMPDDALRKSLPDETATEALGRAIALLLRPGDAVLLDGPLGAGKTVLARALIRALLADPEAEVPSPSFTLVQSYPTETVTLHHFDFWRLQGPLGIPELGWEAARDDVVIAEWPDRLGALLMPDDALSITLTIGGEQAREAVITGWPDRRDQLA